MRILDVSPRPVWPPWDGASVRIHHLLTHLGRRHEIRLFSQSRALTLTSRGEFHDAPGYREYRHANLVNGLANRFCRRRWHGNVLMGVELPVYRPAILDRWLEWADVVLIEQPWLFPYCHRRHPRGRLVLSAHNVELATRASHAEAIGISPRNSLWLRYVHRLERAAAIKADLVITVSEADRLELIGRYAVAADRIVVVPNGSDTVHNRPVGAVAKRELRARLGLGEAPIVIFVSGSQKTPDRVALKWVWRMSRRMGDFTFLVVGHITARPRRERNLILTGPVEDVAPYLQAADVSLCPVQFGGGTKLKVFDALAAALPTVVFEETLIGTALRAGRHLVVSDKTEDELEAHLRRLLAGGACARRLGQAGRDFVVRNHDWEEIARSLERVLMELAGEPLRLTAAVR